MSTIKTALLVLAMAFVGGVLGGLLDGPSEIETMRSIQADLIDASTAGVLK